MLPSSSPVPFLMPRSMFSPGMFTALAASIAVRRRGLPPGSPPPLRAATVISRITLVQDEARLASVIAFFRLICFHLLWPAMSRTPSGRRELGYRESGTDLGNISAAPACGNAPSPLVSPLYAKNSMADVECCGAAAGLRVGEAAQPQPSRVYPGFQQPASAAGCGVRFPQRRSRSAPDSASLAEQRGSVSGLLPDVAERGRLAVGERH